MKLYLTLALFFISTNLFCQYSEINSNFSITFPAKPERIKYPGDAEGFVLQYIASNKGYTIQVISITIPVEYRDGISNSEKENASIQFFDSYLNSVGGGVITNQESRNIQSHKAVLYSVSLKNKLSLYKYANFLRCFTHDYMYTIVYYHNGSLKSFDNYFNAFRIFK